MNLKSLLEAQVFPFVVRPARYIGNELRAIHKSDPSLTRLAIAIPDKYDLGMTQAAWNYIYRAVNSIEGAACERVFAPDLDAEKLLREKKIPLFSLESFKPLKEFDSVLFSLSDELCLTNLLTILDLGELPTWSRDRNDSHPIVGATAPLCFNPEPIADFLDFFFVGDIEESLVVILRLLKERSIVGRLETLKRLSAESGVYVPMFYLPAYENGRLRAIEKKEPAAPDQIKVKSFAGPESQYPSRTIVPFEETAHDHLSVEIIRGSGHSCRFCSMAKYRPKRDREVNSIVNQIEQGIRETGYEEVTLHAYASSDYRHFDQLISILSGRLRDKPVKVNLPLLSSDGRFLESAKRLSGRGKPTLSFAVVAGAERLREAIDRYFSVESFYQSIASALASGWRTFRLNFMVGFPTECDDDLDAIVDIARNCEKIGREYGENATFHINISPFIPRAHTPWQWEKQISLDEYGRKEEYLRRSLRGRSLQLKARATEASYLEGALARGDRRLAEVINRAYLLGVRFDSWSEHFDFAGWVEAFRLCSMDMSEFTRRRAVNEVLPWDHLDKGSTKEQLSREAEMLSRADKPSSTQSSGFKLGDLLILKPEIAEKILVSQPTREVSFGRRPKRKIETVSMVVPRSRVRLSWSKGAAVRFVGHLATMRVFERAIRRAMIPVECTQGHHPRQKLAFGPPLTLGYTSQSEYVDLQLEMPFRDEMIVRLNQSLPEGFHVNQGRPVFGKATSLSSLINLACYEVTLDNPDQVTQIMIDDILAQESVVIRRRKEDEIKEAEVRNSIIKIELGLHEGVNVLYMELAMGNLGFVKPDEILTQCFAIPESEVLILGICRTGLLTVINSRRLTPFEVN